MIGPITRAGVADRRVDGRRDRGSVSVEMALVMSVVVVSFLALVLYAGRVAEAENAAQSAAQAGARAATLEFDYGAAQSRGSAVASQNLKDKGLTCGAPSVGLAKGPWGPGAVVRVSVTCRAKTGDVPELKIGSPATFTEVAYEVVDTFRSEP